jgi:hypothetical protein
MDIKEKIEAYFERTLTEVEMRDVEEAVSQDPELKKEFEFQEDINEALKEVRVAELKAQLESISITTSIFDQTIFKLITSIAIITGVSIIGYWALRSGNESPVTTEAQNEIPLDSLDHPALIHEPDQAQAESSKEVPETTKKTTPVTTPTPVTPHVIEEFADEETREEISIPENDILENAPSASAGISVELKIGTRYNFHYQFLSNRLFLFGNFNEELYDILEIKNDTESQLFFSYKEKFYQLDREQKEITPLQEITNEGLIIRLKSIKDNQ